MSSRRSTLGMALVLAAFGGPLLRAPTRWALLGVLAGAGGAWALGRISPTAGTRLLGAAVVLVFAAALTSPSAAFGAMGRWFSPDGGLVYWNPVIWVGLAGAAAAETRASVGAGLLGALAYAWSPPGSPLSGILEAMVLGLLAAGFAATLEWARRPVLAWPLIGGLTISNLLFMEQYRRNLVPRDDTVAFGQVARSNAALFSDAFGAPGTWPASWIFAARHRVRPGRYEGVARRGWMLDTRDSEVIDLAPAWVDPLLLPLGRHAALDVVLEASGTGTVDVEVNGTRAATVPISPSGGEARVRIHELWRRGVNAVRLVPSAGADVSFGRLTLRRVAGA